MGLSVSLYQPSDVDYWHGTYGLFGRFRDELARVVEIDLDNMAGYKYNGKQWTGDEPFYELFDHPDNEGELYWYECEELVKDFAEYEIAFELETEDLNGVYQEWWELCQECVRVEGVLIFK